MYLPTTLVLNFRADLDILTVRWPGESALTELQAEYDAILVQLQQHRTARLLLDIRRRDAPSAEMSVWFNTDWLPRATRALAPAVLRMAYLISPLRSDQLRRDAMTSTVLARTLAPAGQHELQLFEDEGEAVRWLRLDSDLIDAP